MSIHFFPSSFQCQAIVEDTEEDWLELLPHEKYDTSLAQEICVDRANICKKLSTQGGKKEEL